MKISRKKFVITFLISAFVFQFISNSVLGPEIGLFPKNGEWFPGAGSPVAWKSSFAAIIYPVKCVMVGPLWFLGTDPDGAPPVMLVAFALYWAAMAVVFHFLFGLVFNRRKA